MARPTNTPFHIKVGDRSPSIVRYLTRGTRGRTYAEETATGTAIDLTDGVDAVVITLTPVGSNTPTLDEQDCSSLGSDGACTYAWAANDTDTADHYWAEYEIQYTGGKLETVPNHGHLDVYIHAALS